MLGADIRAMGRFLDVVWGYERYPFRWTPEISSLIPQQGRTKEASFPFPEMCVCVCGGNKFSA